jgi:pantoate--beta-alanine ligase
MSLPTGLPGTGRTADILTVRTVAALREAVAGWRHAGESVALVPTMGGIHDGHLSLVRRARALADRVVVSLFVNPTQFGANEDLSSYPADEVTDCSLLSGDGVDVVYAPIVTEIYPDGFATTVSVSGLTGGLCGAHRPGHFDGVATVVAKLLTQCLPDMALFGEKDWQQLQVIRRLTRDLDLPVEIVGVSTVREADGLALSSRNAYLEEEQRRIAPALHRVLSTLAETVRDPGAGCEGAARAAAASLLEAGFASVDYVSVCDAETLEPLSRVGDPDRARVFGAAHLGPARLIDNVPVKK